MGAVCQVLNNVFGVNQYPYTQEYIVPETHNQILIKTRGV